MANSTTTPRRSVLRTRFSKMAWLMAVVMMLLLTTGCRVIVHDTSLKNGETVQGSLVVIGSDVKLKQGSEVTGRMFVIGGEHQIDGEIKGSLNVLGGIVRLGPKAVIHGSVRRLRGSVRQGSTEVERHRRREEILEKIEKGKGLLEKLTDSEALEELREEIADLEGELEDLLEQER